MLSIQMLLWIICHHFQHLRCTGCGSPLTQSTPRHTQPGVSTFTSARVSTISWGNPCDHTSSLSDGSTSTHGTSPTQSGMLPPCLQTITTDASSSHGCGWGSDSFSVEAVVDGGHDVWGWLEPGSVLLTHVLLRNRGMAKDRLIKVPYRRTSDCPSPVAKRTSVYSGSPRVVGALINTLIALPSSVD